MPRIRVADLECFYEDDYFGPPWNDDPEVILMQTGYGANAAHLQTWVPGLAEEFRVIRRDAVGHGGTTPGDPDHDISLEGLAEDVVRFLDALGIESVHFFGERTGGMTGITLAARYPERVKSLAILGSPIRCGEGLQRAMHAMLSPELQAQYSGWNDSIRGLGGAFAWHDEVQWLHTPDDPARSAWQRAQLRRCDEALLERYAAATLTFDIEHYLAEVTTPTLIFAATSSYRTPLEDQLFMRRALASAEIEVLEGHNGRADDGDTARTAARLRSFVAAHRAAS